MGCDDDGEGTGTSDGRDTAEEADVVFSCDLAPSDCIIEGRFVNQRKMIYYRGYPQIGEFCISVHPITHTTALLARFRLQSRKIKTVNVVVQFINNLLTEHMLALKSKLRCFKKNHVVKFNHQRSGQTISHYMHAVLLSVLKMHTVLFVRPEPGCLGVIDDTYISVHVPEVDKGIYRMRKGTISTNVLVACDCNYNCMFTYILPGWEGSASDARVLRDFISKVHGLKVPIGIYYLCDNGYANSPGFLSPYHSVRYHLSEWGPQSMRPQTYLEHFNMCHTRARNVIERAFGIIKIR
ncbi:hypothetical protein ACS0TY_011227 [Phlomoides rotata]